MVGIKTVAIPSSLRRTNERNIIGLLLRLGAASRAELAKAAGMSQPTAGKITSALLAMGILEELDDAGPAGAGAAPKTARVGRPGRLLRLNSARARFMVIEMGVNETRLAALPVSARSDDRWSRTFPTRTSPDEWLAQLTQAAAALPNHQFWGALISVPGIVDEEAGKVLFSPNLHWTERLNLPEVVRQVWPVPVLLVQEIRALALGHLAVEPGAEDFLLVDFGQGVGGAIIEGGRLFSSPLPLNGEFGHTPVPGNPRRCGCGATGCVETLVSERGLLESFAAAQPAGERAWPALVEHIATRGLPAWLSASLEAAAATIAGALNVLGLKEVVVTGTLADLPPVVIEYLSSAINRGAMWARFGKLTIRSAPRRRLAGLVVVGIDRLVVPSATDGRRRSTYSRSPSPHGHAQHSAAPGEKPAGTPGRVLSSASNPT